MKYLKIPMDRIGALIGHKGETKKDLEDKLGVKLDIDSKTGDVTIDDHEIEDPLSAVSYTHLTLPTTPYV